MSASTWGDPNATKRVLLIHGITSSSHACHGVATRFASRGYFVIAPDLLGHGNARRGSDYTIAALVDELQPYLTAAGGDDHLYDIVVGHSLGGVVASALLPLFKSTQPVRVVLVDPPLEQTPETTAILRPFFRHLVEDPDTPEGIQQRFPLCTKEEAIFTSLGPRLCDAAATEAILDQNVPWSFSHQLLAAPDNVELTVLAADPSKRACVREEDLKAYPRVKSKTVRGASHLIQLDAPQAIIEAALEGTEPQN